MSRDSRVPEHLDTRCIVDNISSWESHGTVIFVKLKPFGRYNNRLVTDWIPSIRRNSRDPVSLGEVEEAFQPISLFRRVRETKVRSPSTGKEQMKLKISKRYSPIHTPMCRHELVDIPIFYLLRHHNELISGHHRPQQW